MTALFRQCLVLGCLPALACALPAQAEEGRYFETGNEIYSGCGKDSPKRPATTRYVSGFADGHRVAAQGAAQGAAARLFCIPEEFSASQVTDIVCLALQRHTEIRHRPAAYTVLKALTDEYPCR